MARCKSCGAYCGDIYEWPEEERENFVPNLCFDCYQEKLSQTEDEEESDPNDDFGMGELKPDPEDDDTPDIQDDEEQSDNNELEEKQNDESDSLPDEVSALENIRRMLFG